jgi:3-deoxy-manno-octulosonate cytidylyltransferase (CMP-KDO synthetase)
MARKGTAIIPARLGSTRFPAKALASETGKPLVVHVCEQAAQAETIGRVVVATDATEIFDAVEAHGFKAVMTSVDHPNGTSRLGEACDVLGLLPTDVVLNVQGDEPEIEPSAIDAAYLALCRSIEPPENAVGTVVEPIRNQQDLKNPNIVKAVLSGFEPISAGGQAALAHYFSRAAIPFRRVETSEPSYRHVGIYSYTVRSIHAYLGWEPSPLEVSESLEQLRWLAHGYQIWASPVEGSHPGIDTPEQYSDFVDRYTQKKT